MAHRLYRRGRIWYAWGFDAHGERWKESTKQTDRRAAEIIAREINRRRAFATTTDAPVPLGVALTAVLNADARANRSRHTIAIHRLKGRHLIAYFGADKNIRALRPEHTAAYCDARIATGVTRHTAFHEIATLRRAFRVVGLAWPQELMPNLGKVYAPRMRWMPYDEFALVRSKMSVEHAEYFTAFCYSGCRDSELYRINPEHIDRARNQLFIDGTKTEGSKRWIPMHAELVRVLDARVERRPIGALFPRWGNVQRDMKAAAKRAGVPPITPNDCRRTFVSWLANSGAPLLVAARLVGHSSVRMVEKVYAHLGIDVKQEAVLRLPGGGTGGPGSKDTEDQEDTKDNGNDQEDE